VAALRASRKAFNMATNLVNTKDRVIRVIATETEKQELRLAAARVSLPVAVFVREAALEKARANPERKPDWASFFARDFGIPSDWTLEREQPQPRDVFPASSDNPSTNAQGSEEVSK
jgi:hypothetical protein